MGYEEIREQTAAILASVEGMGVVHQYQRWAKSWEKFLDLFSVKDDAGVGRINGWMITRAATPEKWLTNVNYLRVYELVMYGFYGLKDAAASELVFQNLIEEACASFRENDTLNGTCETIAPEFGALAGRAGVQVEIVEPRMFGNTLCHYCKLRLGAQITGVRS